MSINKLILSTFLIALVISACEKTDKLLDENTKWNYVDSTQNGGVKIIHAFASLSPSVASGTGPKVMIVRDTSVIFRDSLAYNATFPGPSGAYSVTPAGNHNFLFILNRGKTDPQQAGDTVFKSSLNVVAGKNYTTFLVDSTEKPGTYTVEDNWGPPVQSKYQIRFANLVPNPIDRYDVYADSIGMPIATNIGYREISNFIYLPLPRNDEQISVRKTGTNTVVYTLGNFNPVSQRVYTVYSRGRNGTTGRTPGLAFYTNR